MKKWVEKTLHMPMPYSGSIIWRSWRALTEALCDAYRPERHYMRGPGPKHRAKASSVTPKSQGANDSRERHASGG